MPVHGGKLAARALKNAGVEVLFTHIRKWLGDVGPRIVHQNMNGRRIIKSAIERCRISYIANHRMGLSAESPNISSHGLKRLSAPGHEDDICARFRQCHRTACAQSF